MSESKVPDTTVDLSHAGVDNIIAALANAGLAVHYNETDGDTFLDVWLTDFDATDATILSWRGNGEGWQLRRWEKFGGDTNAQTPDRKWPVAAGSPAEVARDVASVLAEPTTADEPEQNWYFTFGSGHVHPDSPGVNAMGGESLADKYVSITGTFESARAVMVRHFGTAWCDQYASAERAGVEEFGLTELHRRHWPTPAEPEESASYVPGSPYALIGYLASMAEGAAERYPDDPAFKRGLAAYEAWKATPNACLWNPIVPGGVS